MLQQRLVLHQSGSVSSDGLAGHLARLFFSSGAQPRSHRPLCEAVGRRPLSPAVFGYPSDIQLFLTEEAHFWQPLDLDSRKLCLTPFLFVSISQSPVSLSTGLRKFACCSLSLSLLLSSPYHSELTTGQEGRHGTYKGKGQDGGHVSNVYCCPHRPRWQLSPAPEFPGMGVLP